MIYGLLKRNNKMDTINNIQVDANFTHNIITSYMVCYDDNVFNPIEYCNNVNLMLDNLSIKVS